MRMLILSHYSATGLLSDHVRYAVEHYHAHTDGIVFVSTSKLETAERKLLTQHCSSIIERENVGYDFLSWKTGIEALGPLDQIDEIIIANDSVVGPLGEAEEFFGRLRADPRDVCGLTLSWEGRRHIQSYFVRFSKAALRSGAFDDFWQEVAPLADKKQIIDRYELGLTSVMDEHGHSTGALFEVKEPGSMADRLAHWAQEVDWKHPQNALRSLRRIVDADALNPTIDLWRACFDAGVPFLKRELLRDNPGGVNVGRVLAEAEMRYGITPNELLAWAKS